MVLVQKSPFFQLSFFRQYGPGKCFLPYSGKEKSPFQAIETRTSKSRNIDIFQKGLTQALVEKWAFFKLFFQAKKARKMSLTILWKGKLPFQARKMSYTLFQNGKWPFQTIRTRSSKSRKLEIFPKGLTQGFGPKMAIFPNFFFFRQGQENVFYDILARKIAFLGYENRKFKKSIKAKKMSFTIIQNGKSPFRL